jgi:hypothetical protein
MACRISGYGNWIIAGIAAVCVVTGIALSRVIEPGIRVEKLMLATESCHRAIHALLLLKRESKIR